MSDPLFSSDGSEFNRKYICYQCMTTGNRSGDEHRFCFGGSYICDRGHEMFGIDVGSYSDVLKCKLVCWICYNEDK